MLGHRIAIRRRNIVLFGKSKREAEAAGGFVDDMGKEGPEKRARLN
jgi:hypothetical protein